MIDSTGQTLVINSCELFPIFFPKACTSSTVVKTSHLTGRLQPQQTGLFRVFSGTGPMCWSNEYH